MTTTATKHTPGPWRVAFRGAGGWRLSSSAWAEDFRSIGFTAADARLIASAPGLLAERDRLRAENAELRAALRNFTSWHAEHFEDFASDINAQLLCLANDADAALAKAKG